MQCTAVVEDGVEQEAVHLGVDTHGRFHVGVERHLAFDGDQSALALGGHLSDGLHDFREHTQAARFEQTSEQGVLAQVHDAAPQLLLEQDGQDDHDVAAGDLEQVVQLVQLERLGQDVQAQDADQGRDLPGHAPGPSRGWCARSPRRGRPRH